MRKLVTTLAATSAILVAGSLVGKADATTVTGVGSLPLTTLHLSPMLPAGADSTNAHAVGRCGARCEAQPRQPRRSEEES
jgi:hypothetical protein